MDTTVRSPYIASTSSHTNIGPVFVPLEIGKGALFVPTCIVTEKTLLTLLKLTITISEIGKENFRLQHVPVLSHLGYSALWMVTSQIANFSLPGVVSQKHLTKNSQGSRPRFHSKWATNSFNSGYSSSGISYKSGCSFFYSSQVMKSGKHWKKN